ncbi:MAG: hypothetical protein ACFB22_02050 [Rhodothalassiaceae bacterium]
MIRLLLMWSLLALAVPAAAQGPAYTVNGQPVDPQTQQMLQWYGLPPGAYYIDQIGNFGRVGEPPVANVYGGPPRLPNGQPMPPGQTAPQPQRQPQAAPQQAPGGGGGGGLAGLRIFWVYSPSIFSGATGGSSGYIHLCPNNVFHRSSEGSLSVGGDYNSEYQMNDSWAGMAHTARSAGRWQVQNSPQGQMLMLTNPDGSQQSFYLNAIRQGRWSIGRTKYAVEQGKAQCR